MAGLRTYVTREQSSRLNTLQSDINLPASPLTPPASLKFISTPSSPLLGSMINLPPSPATIFNTALAATTNYTTSSTTMSSMKPTYPNSPDLTSPTSLYILFTLPSTSDSTSSTTPLDAEATPIAVTNSPCTSAFSSPTSSPCFSSTLEFTSPNYTISPSTDFPTISPFSSPSLSPVGFVREGRNIHIPYDDFLDGSIAKRVEDVIFEDAMQRKDSYFTFCESESTLEFHFPVPPRSPVKQQRSYRSTPQISSFEERFCEASSQTFPWAQCKMEPEVENRQMQTETEAKKTAGEHVEAADKTDAQAESDAEQSQSHSQSESSEADDDADDEDDENDEHCQASSCFGVDSGIDLDWEDGEGEDGIQLAVCDKRSAGLDDADVSPTPRNPSDPNITSSARSNTGLGLGLGIVGI